MLSCLLSFFLIFERNKIRNVISILSQIFEVETVFSYCLHFFHHSFSFTETQINDTSIRRIVSYKIDLWIFCFVLFCFCFCFLFCFFVYTPFRFSISSWLIALLLYMHSTFATHIRTYVSVLFKLLLRRFISFLHVSLVHRHTQCDCITSIGFMVVLLESLVIWNALRGGNQVVLSRG